MYYRNRTYYICQIIMNQVSKKALFKYFLLSQVAFWFGLHKNWKLTVGYVHKIRNSKRNIRWTCLTTFIESRVKITFSFDVTPVFTGVFKFVSYFIHGSHLHSVELIIYKKLCNTKSMIYTLKLFSCIFIYQNMLHAVSLEPGRMFGLDITSGCMCYSRILEPTQPISIALYDTKPEVSFYSKKRLLNYI